MNTLSRFLFVGVFFMAIAAGDLRADHELVPGGPSPEGNSSQEASLEELQRPMRQWESFDVLSAEQDGLIPPNPPEGYKGYESFGPKSTTLLCPKQLLKVMAVKLGAQFSKGGIQAYARRNLYAQVIAFKIRQALDIRGAACDGTENSDGAVPGFAQGYRIQAQDGVLSEKARQFLLSRLCVPTTFDEGLAIGVAGAHDIERVLMELIVFETEQRSENQLKSSLRGFGTGFVGAGIGVATLLSSVVTWLNPGGWLSPLIDGFAGAFPNAPALSTSLLMAGGGTLVVSGGFLNLAESKFVVSDRSLDKFLHNVQKDVLSSKRKPGFWSYSFNHRNLEGDLIVFSQPEKGVAKPEMILMVRVREDVEEDDE